MKRVGILSFALALLFGGWLATAGPDDEFVLVYNLIQAGDTLSDGGQKLAAQEKYLQAQAALEKLAREFPYWNPTIITYRRQYLADKLGPAAARLPAATNAAPAAPATSPDERDQRIVALNREITGLRQDRALLEAKLREALAVQPATVDPRELAKAEDHVKQLQQENDTLRANVTAQEAKLAQAADPAALAAARQSLKKANDDLARQSAQLAALTRDKQKLEARLQKREKSSASATESKALADTQRALKDANQALAKQSATVSTLTQEKTSLEQQLKDANVKLATSSHTAAPAPVKQSADTAALAAANTQLAEVKQTLAAEQSKNNVLQAEKAALQKRLDELARQPASAAAAAPAPVETKPPVSTRATKAEAKRQIKELEAERDELRKRVNTLNRELDSRHERRELAQGGQLAEEVTILRARLAAYESQKVPYTPEEMTLFKQTASVTQPAPVFAATKPAREIPSDAVPLVAEAQREFANHQYAAAESKYVQALKLDETNVGMLNDLAATQIEEDHLDAGEASLKRSLAQDPDNANALALMGLLRFKQKRYDDALDTLSRSVKINPDNAVAQNYLGITLSEKGLRGPAEAALRRAVTLRPDYAEAQNNLAVIYATQKPPFLALARWHYQRAIAAGQPKQPELEKLLFSDGKQP